MPNISVVRELTPKQKIFVDTYINNGGNFAEAYVEAYKTDHLQEHQIYAKGHEVLRIPQVDLYIMQHRAALGSKTTVDLNLLTESMLWAMNNARNTGALSVVSKTAMELAKLHGLIIEKHEVDNTHKFQIMEAIEVGGEKLDFNIGDGTPMERPTIIDVTPDKVETNVDDLV